LPAVVVQAEPAGGRAGIFDYVGLLFLGLALLVVVGALARRWRGR
jgi:hypothetical protein